MLPRFGHLFVTTFEAATALDLEIGPTSPIQLGDGRKLRAPASNRSIPYTYEPSFFDILASAVTSEAAALEPIRKTNLIGLYRFPAVVTRALAQRTPERAEFTQSRIAEITAKLMQSLEVSTKFKESGVSSAVLIVRGHALKTLPDAGKSELYYWFKHTS